MIGRAVRAPTDRRSPPVPAAYRHRPAVTSAAGRLWMRLEQLPTARRVRGAVDRFRAVAADVGVAVGAIWRRSMQVRVVVSTLALSAAVVLVLGLVLQTQIAGRILQGKESDALGQAEAGRAVLERELAGVDPDREGAQGELNKALDRLTNASLADDAGSPSAGEFRAVLTTGPRDAATSTDGAGRTRCRRARSRTCRPTCAATSPAARSPAATSPSPARASTSPR